MSSLLLKTSTEFLIPNTLFFTSRMSIVLFLFVPFAGENYASF